MEGTIQDFIKWIKDNEYDCAVYIDRVYDEYLRGNQAEMEEGKASWSDDPCSELSGGV